MRISHGVQDKFKHFYINDGLGEKRCRFCDTTDYRKQIIPTYFPKLLWVERLGGDWFEWRGVPTLRLMGCNACIGTMGQYPLFLLASAREFVSDPEARQRECAKFRGAWEMWDLESLVKS